jgi:hypothetical protein
LRIGHLFDGTKLEIFVDNYMVTVEATGDPIALAEIGQLFAWLGAACQESSPNEMRSSTARVRLARKSIHSAARIEIGFFLEGLESDQHEFPKNGSCWHSLFENSVIVQGFPILARKHEGKGLEIPLNMMAGLGEASHVTTFDGSLVIKGFSTMFVPTGRTQNSVFWHFLYEENLSRISYLCARERCSNQVLIESGDAILLGSTRHFLGWASSAETRTGKLTFARASVRAKVNEIARDRNC